MKKRLGYVATLLFGSVFTLVMGESILKFANEIYQKFLQMLQFSPWYITLLGYGIFAFAVLGVCVCLKKFLKKIKKDVWIIRL